MSESFQINAPAKTNLWLRVLGKRDDGFHEIDTRMVRLTLADELTLQWTDDGTIDLSCDDPTLPVGEENLVIKAVRALEERSGKKFSVSIDLIKKIPTGAGLGGGSSDAAATLLALNEMAELHLDSGALAEVGAQIGSDVPFFIYRQSCDCRGRGEVVEPVPEEIHSLSVVLLKPGFEISAAWAYQNYADSKEYPDTMYLPQVCQWGQMVNDLERPVFEKFVVLAEMKSWLLSQPEVHAALLSGSGSTMLAVLKRNDDGQPLIDRALNRYGKAWWAWVGRTI